MTYKIQIISIVLAVLMIGALSVLGIIAPKDFPEGARFAVHEDESLYSVSKRLKEEHIISSALLFRGWVSTIGKDTSISLGVYEFPHTMPLGNVVAKILKGPDEPLVSVTIPEGYTTKEIASAFAKAIPDFSADIFGELVHARTLDGYLFPSTYYPLPSSTEADIIKLLNETFEKEYGKRFSSLPFPAAVSTRNDVISLAAILEGEAKTQEDMKIVSGILQKRLQKGMRLQVDVAEVTYQKSGLPAQPINNPGLIAIDAVFHAQESPYLYYLTGKDGTMHYAKTFEEHKNNIQKYLR